MPLIEVGSFTAGRWLPPGDAAREVRNAVTGAVMARAGGGAWDAGAVLAHAREAGGLALRALTFHQRAKMLKALALYLQARKQALYDLSFATGATAKDHLIDVDGGIGTMLVIASKGRREMPDGHVYPEGAVEHLSRGGTFLGQHVCVPLQGVAVHVNAFNFPVWGMLEKLAPCLLAGVPAVVRPATDTAYVTEAAFRMIVDSGILPAGAVQMVTGDVGGLLAGLGAQDVVAFTGSAMTAGRVAAALVPGVRFMAEQDSLNASILGPDAGPGTPEFDLFIKGAAREMTVKAGQKCTAIRRMIVPRSMEDAVIAALSARLARVVVGDPRAEGVTMGALVSRAQRADVLDRLATLQGEAQRVFGDPDAFDVTGADAQAGAFLPPVLLHCADPMRAARVHDTEAFGPVATVMGYDRVADAVALANRGGGSLVVSLVTRDAGVARDVVLGAAAWHGRIHIDNRDSMAEATGHGAPMPHMIHGGPGRAGGGEELGGVRGVLHYMQRTAVQGSPDMLTAITGQYVPGAAQGPGPVHPFRRSFHELSVGETLHTPARTVTQDDIEHFAAFTGDRFYAHMDADAAARNPFFPGRVAHGYLLLSFAAGLFVDPDEGPVLANTGLEGLRFLKPVQAGDSIAVTLTVARKTPRTESYGEVRWHVALHDQGGEAVADYTLLTMVAYRAPEGADAG